MKELVRKNVLTIKPYVAGKPIEETKRQRKPKSAEYRERWDLLSDGLFSR